MKRLYALNESLLDDVEIEEVKDENERDDVDIVDIKITYLKFSIDNELRNILINVLESLKSYNSGSWFRLFYYQEQPIERAFLFGFKFESGCVDIDTINAVIMYMSHVLIHSVGLKQFIFLAKIDKEYHTIYDCDRGYALTGANLFVDIDGMKLLFGEDSEYKIKKSFFVKAVKNDLLYKNDGYYLLPFRMLNDNGVCNYYYNILDSSFEYVKAYSYDYQTGKRMLKLLKLSGSSSKSITFHINKRHKELMMVYRENCHNYNILNLKTNKWMFYEWECPEYCVFEEDGDVIVYSRNYNDEIPEEDIIMNIMDASTGEFLYEEDELSNINAFCEGFAVIESSEGLQYIDKYGNLLNNEAYKEAHDFVNGYAAVEFCKDDGGYMTYIDKTGKHITEKRFIKCYDFDKDGVAFVIEEDSDAKYSLIGTDGERICEEMFERIFISRKRGSGFVDGIAKVMYNGDYTFINTKGKRITDIKIAEAKNFREGFAAIRLESIGWTFMDTSGNIISDKRYSEVNDFSNGFAKVDDCKYIDQNGKELELLENAGISGRYGNLVIVYTLDGAKIDSYNYYIAGKNELLLKSWVKIDSDIVHNVILKSSKCGLHLIVDSDGRFNVVDENDGMLILDKWTDEPVYLIDDRCIRIGTNSVIDCDKNLVLAI